MELKDIIIESIFNELRKAEDKFPGWPDDPVHAGAILAEEAGELTQATLDYFYGREDSMIKMEKEAAQVGAMAIRFLIGIEYYKKNKDIIPDEDGGL